VDENKVEVGGGGGREERRGEERRMRRRKRGLVSWKPSRPAVLGN
jgi:hypothetical protein